MQPKPPFFVVEKGGDIEIFWSIEEIENYIEPIDVENNEYIVYDSNGYLFDLKTEVKYKSFLFVPFIKIPIKVVKVQLNKFKLKSEYDLRKSIISFMEQLGQERSVLETMDLNNLIRLIVNTIKHR